MCQEIIDPYLIDGYKFHLRLYALVTSWHPLRAFLCEDGQVLMAAKKWDPERVTRDNLITNTGHTK